VLYQTWEQARAKGRGMGSHNEPPSGWTVDRNRWCDPKMGDGIGNGFIQVHVCSRRHVAGRQHAETAPHRNSTSPEDGGPPGTELHTA